MKKALMTKLAAIILGGTLVAGPVFAAGGGGGGFGDTLAGAASVNGAGGGGTPGPDPVWQELKADYQKAVDADRQLREKLGSQKAFNDRKYCDEWLKTQLSGIYSRQDLANTIKFHNLDRYGLEALAAPEITELGTSGNRLLLNHSRNLDWAYGCLQDDAVNKDGVNGRGMWTAGRPLPAIDLYRAWAFKWWTLTYPALVKTVGILNDYYKRADQGLPPVVVPGSPRPKNDAEAEKLIKLAQRELLDALKWYPFNDPRRFNAETVAKQQRDTKEAQDTMKELNAR